ncbi:hypothetical protein BN1182_CK_00630 [Pantoea ananatis]|nr:hypothetical protein BN1182_CK_00630 [Pantoea ananatis]
MAGQGKSATQGGAKRRNSEQDDKHRIASNELTCRLSLAEGPSDVAGKMSRVERPSQRNCGFTSLIHHFVRAVPAHQFALFTGKFLTWVAS